MCSILQTLTAWQQGRNAMPIPEPNPDDGKSDRGQFWREPLGKVVRLSYVDPDLVQWLSPGRLAAGKFTVLDGDPGLGKSTLLCEWAARITRGQALPGGTSAAPRDVIILSAEDDLRDTIRPRIDAAGGDSTRIVSLLAVPDGSPFGRPFVIPGHVLLLEALVVRTDAALVIVD